MNRLFFVLLFGFISLSSCATQENAGEDSVTPSPTLASVPTKISLQDLTFVTLAPPTIEVIEQTPTPLPTATATPTPTPIVYAIQAGDTLLGVAIDNQTTVEEIQRLNPNVRPELLSIGEEIVLPPPATPVFDRERPTPLPVQVDIRSTSLFSDGAGGLWVLGEVENVADYFLENLRLEIVLYGQSGEAVGRAETWAVAPLIQPAASAPFGILFPQKPEGDLQAQVKVISGFTQASLAQADRAYFRLTADEPQFNLSEETVVVEGNVTNEGDQIATSITVLVTTYDAANRLTGFAQFSPFPSLEPGQGASYSYELVPPGGQVDRVQVKLFAQK